MSSDVCYRMIHFLLQTDKEGICVVKVSRMGHSPRIRQAFFMTTQLVFPDAVNSSLVKTPNSLPEEYRESQMLSDRRITLSRTSDFGLASQTVSVGPWRAGRDRDRGVADLGQASPVPRRLSHEAPFRRRQRKQIFKIFKRSAPTRRIRSAAASHGR